ncbi:PS Dcarbxylase-domain-containing protein [Cladophialophora carrionii]|uniref:PS Dcarbxylase-domain-containing protein n=1 Tax=Cladophialophora carrionii TaxID=86049 RepID=A0A1C1CWF9_9EURO|nr:PS Dcarbxylase-domain-containing protein [Cladophialophora carrionii]
MGSYVMDRATGEKTFEQVSISVRVGMHLLYYGSRQMQHCCTSSGYKRSAGKQHVKMGRAYYSPEKQGAHPAHVGDEEAGPGALLDLFNEFFAREVRPNARTTRARARGRARHVVAGRLSLDGLPHRPPRDQVLGQGIFGFTLETLLGDTHLAEYFDRGQSRRSRGWLRRTTTVGMRPSRGRSIMSRSSPARYYTVNLQTISQEGTLNVFAANRRDVLVNAPTPVTGNKVAVVAVGAMLVGSIKWNPGMEEPGKTMKRGDLSGARSSTEAAPSSWYIPKVRWCWMKIWSGTATTISARPL